MNQKIYAQITDALVDNGYIIIENGFSINSTQKLFSFAQNEALYKEALISRTSDAHIDKTKRSDKTLWLAEDDAVQSEYLAFMQGLQEYLNQSLYLGLKYYESHFALYEEGSFYEKHLDSFKNSKSRVVTTVFYLNEAWYENDGGELMLYDKSDTVLEKISPTFGKLLIFLSEKYPHEVLMTKKKRYSIAGWFRVDEVL